MVNRYNSHISKAEIKRCENLEILKAIGCDRSDLLGLEEYKMRLVRANIDIVEIEFEKESGNKVNFVLPACKFKSLGRTDIAKLFRGMAK